MWGFPFVFWLILLTVLVVRGGPRRWQRIPPPWAERDPDARRQREDEVQLLEVRVARLEERLEFTEKLLMERSEAPK